MVDNVNIALPTCFKSERVTIYFGKSIRKIDLTFRFVYPKNGILVEGFEVACFVERHKLVDNGPLFVVFRILPSLAEHLANTINCIAVKPSTTPDILVERAIGIAFQTAVQANHRWSLWVSLLFEFGIKAFRFGLGNAFFVVITRGGQQQILTISLVDAL